MKIPGDIRKLKKLDFIIGYKRKLMKVYLIFDNLKFKSGKISGNLLNGLDCVCFTKPLLKNTLLPERD